MTGKLRVSSHKYAIVHTTIELLKTLWNSSTIPNHFHCLSSAYRLYSRVEPRLHRATRAATDDIHSYILRRAFEHDELPSLPTLPVNIILRDFPSQNIHPPPTYVKTFTQISFAIYTSSYAVVYAQTLNYCDNLCSPSSWTRFIAYT